MLTTKKCNRCEQNKKVSDFYRRKNSPDGYRGTCKSCSNGRARTAPRGIANGGRLPIGPFRSWLEGRLTYYGTTKELAAVTGLEERQLYRLMYESKRRVSLDVVDRALTNERSTALWELGYTEEDFAYAAHENAKTERKRK